MPAQTSANNTAWSLKKSIKPPSGLPRHKVNAEGSPARGIMYHKRPRLPGSGAARDGVRKGELEARRPLLEVGRQLRRNCPGEHGRQRAERLDREPYLLEVRLVLAEAPVRERGDGRQGLHEQVRDRQGAERGEQLLLVGGRLSHGPARQPAPRRP